MTNTWSDLVMGVGFIVAMLGICIGGVVIVFGIATLNFSISNFGLHMIIGGFIEFFVSAFISLVLFCLCGNKKVLGGVKI